MSTLPGDVPTCCPGLGPGGRLSAAAIYELLCEAGHGGVGIVYRAVQVGLGRPVAVKTVSAGAPAQARVLTCFRAEARALARLQHPNIVQLHASGECGGLPWLALEYLGGGTLGGQRRGKPWPPEQAARLVHTLARAVGHAHRRGVVHGDLKPANVLFSEEGVPKLIDFGLARLLDDPPDLADGGGFMGTPAYMAPEQASGTCRGVNPLTDIYALGAILYELLTSRPPFLAPTRTAILDRVRRCEPVPPRCLRETIPVDLEAICLRCLHKEPGRRFPDAFALAQELRRFLRRRAAGPQRRSA